jgi:TatD DNase family protein
MQNESSPPGRGNSGGGRGGRGWGQQGGSPGGNPPSSYGYRRGGGGGGCCDQHTPYQGKKPRQCLRCGEYGHIASECTSETVRQQSDFAIPPVPTHSVPFFDTHCHVDYICEQSRVPNWAQFKAANPPLPTYAGCITTFCDSTAICSSFSQHPDLASNHPEVYFTWGLHPHNAKYWNDRVESRIAEMVSHPQCVGFGEIGLDVTSEKKQGSEEEQQLIVFCRQLELAKVFEKPIVIHFRGKSELLLDLLQANLPPTQKLHLHCWGDPSLTAADKFMAYFPNLYFGFTGMIVNNSNMAQLVAHVPMERIVLETDGPYMLPSTLKPPKGSRILFPVNHPGNIPHIAAEVGRIKKISIDRVLTVVAQNVQNLYGINILGTSGVAPQAEGVKVGTTREGPASPSDPPKATAFPPLPPA